VTEILDGKKVAAAIRAEVAAGARELAAGGGRPPGLTVIRVGDDPASEVYVASKTRAAEEAGFTGGSVVLPAATTAAELVRRVHELNASEEVDGILLQLPLPQGLPEPEILLAIDPDKDVDGLHPLNAGRLWSDQEGFVPCTPGGILELLRRYQVPLAGRHAVVVGRSRLVGKPMAALLLQQHCTVTVCHSRTRDLPDVCSRADLLIAALGRAALLGPEHVREGAVVVDVGINRIDDRARVESLFPGDEQRLATLARRGAVLVGDVDYTRVAPRASLITPVPGGVGPLTVAMLLANTLLSSRRHQGRS
jgi:methylenetetrahydrofolate dehydrogenase (NADP+)/methenyltetrahydrofolate cyclohydrolase